MLTFTPDGRSVLVANEGEPSADYETDPEGSVTIVDAVTFDSEQARFAAGKDYEDVRVFGPGASPAQDFEPEYIAADPGGRLAYVTLQEADAVAILDLKQRRFRSVRSLGLKDWGARDYDGFSEEVRAGSLPLDPTALPAAQRSALSRLNVTNTAGDDDGDGDYDRLLTFGGRSMSVLDDALNVRYDTGAELERETLAGTPSLFDADHGPALEPDNRSDDKGPEPEGVAVGAVGGRQYAFLGLERHSGIVAYDLEEEPGRASLAALAHSRPIDRGPEGIAFVPASDSPSGVPLLLVTNETTSTIGVWQVAPAG